MRATRLHLSGALLALLLAGTACQTAQRQSALLPPQAAAPRLQAAAAPPPAADIKPAPAPQVAPEPQPDPVAELISRVEMEYQAGQDNYRAGHLEAAKQNFDRAFNLLLESPLDIRSDQRLQA